METNTEAETMTGAEIYMQVEALRGMVEEAYNEWHAASVAYGEMDAVLPDETERALLAQRIELSERYSMLRAARQAAETRFESLTGMSVASFENRYL